jgi:nucleoside-diphosphate-sugar epimerase
MRILITGGNGYIGNSLYNGLKEFYDVKKISRNDLDLTDSRQVNDFFDKGCYDIIIHCAVKGGSRLKEDEWNIIDNNLKMYYNLSSNKHCFNKFIHFGSGAELFNQDTPYGLSKHVIRQSILDKENFYNLRIFAVFDELELESRFIKANIIRYINKQCMEIHQNKYMSFFYMQDLIRTINYYIEEKNPQKEFDCMYNDIYTLEVIASMINNLDTHKVDIIKHTEGLGTSYYGNNLIRPNIDFIGLEDGIKEVYNKLKNK